MKDPIIGVWAGEGAQLLAQVHNVPILKLTCKRIQMVNPVVLVPWDTALDHLEAAVVGWHMRCTRCHPDERIAMRDLVADIRAEIGMVVNGACADIDSAEVRLAFARLNNGFEKYESKRLRAYPAATWLGFNDSEDAWAIEPRSRDELARLLPPTGLELDTRYLTRRAAR